MTTAVVLAHLAWQRIDELLSRPVSLRVLVLVVAAAQGAHLILNH